MPVDLNRLCNLAQQLQDRMAKTQPRARAGHDWGRVTNLAPSVTESLSWYRIANRAQDVAEVYIYDAIGEWGVSDQAFVADLAEVKASRIDLHLNSPGGDYFDGLGIYTALVNHPATVAVHVDGIAASAASFIAMAADPYDEKSGTGGVVIEKHARMMIHDTVNGVYGNARDMREMADLLDSFSDGIAEMYADRAGGTPRKWRDAMLAETWYRAAEAVSAGLADRVAGEDQDEDEDGRQGPDNKTTVAAPAASADEFDAEEFRRIMQEAFQ